MKPGIFAAALIFLAGAGIFFLFAGGGPELEAETGSQAFDLSEYKKEESSMSYSPQNTEEAVLGGGCFWCVEAVYERIEGVLDVVSGYAGGTAKSPSYEQVTTGRTGHAEVVKITFDPEKISYREILEIFWKSHNPTTLNRQGADVGTQYRSIILPVNSEQHRTAEESLKTTDSSGLYSDPLVTEIKDLDTFYPAEDYHQDYFEKNPYAGYCQVVIAPKIKKLGLEGAF